LFTLALLSPKSANRIYARSPPSREKAGNERDGDQNNQSRAKCDRIARAHFIKQFGHQARQQQCRGGTDHDSGVG